MLEYILRLLILLPIVGAMAWGSLWLWKKVQMGQLGIPMTGQRQGRALELRGVLPLGPGAKLAVVEFSGKEILIAISRNGITRLADSGEIARQMTGDHERIISPYGDGDFHVG
jgi:flagellar protein FliO/FliZ